MLQATIVDEERAPISGAFAYLIRSESSEPVTDRIPMSNEYGKLVWELPTGRFDMEIIATGYESSRLSLEIERGTIYVLNFTLKRM